MVKEEINYLRRMITPNKLKIFDYIKIKKVVPSINELAKILNIDYKNCYRYIKDLEKEGIISLSQIKFKEIVIIKFNLTNELYPQNNTQDTPETPKSRFNSSYMESPFKAEPRSSLRKNLGSGDDGEKA